MKEPRDQSALHSAGREFTIAATIYIALPVVLFVMTWLKPWIAWPLGLGLVATVVLLFKEFARESSELLSRKTIILLGIGAVAWALVAGVGDCVPQTEDYVKHNILYHDLSSKSWPVMYHTNSGERFLCYGLAYYLIPALVSSHLGVTAGNVAAILWAGAGFFLTLYWVAAMTRKRPGATALIFVLFSAAPIFSIVHRNAILPKLETAAASPSQPGASIPANQNTPPPPESITAAFSKLGVDKGGVAPLIYSCWTPQHGIPGWLGAGLLYELLIVRGMLSGGFFVGTLLLGWSPLSCVGLLAAPLAWIQRRGPLRPLRVAQIFAGGALFLIFFWYYTGHVPIAERALIWSIPVRYSWIPYYVIYLVTKVLYIVAFIWLVDRRWKVLGAWRPLVVSSTLVLLLLPLYKIGYFGDLRMEGSNSGFTYTAVAAAICLTSERFSLKKPSFTALTAITLFAAGLNIYVYGVTLQKNRTINTTASATSSVLDLKHSAFDMAAQYLGSTESFAFKNVLRTPEDVERSQQ